MNLVSTNPPWSGELGVSSDGTALHYKASPIHRIVDGFLVQGGDIVTGTGTSGVSIYGDFFDGTVLLHCVVNVFN